MTPRLPSPVHSDNRATSLRPLTLVLKVLAFLLVALASQPLLFHGSADAFVGWPSKGSVFAIDPDVTIRRIDPRAPSNAWSLASGWGIPPLFYHTVVPGVYDRLDLLYPMGCREDSNFRSRFRFTPFVDCQWSKLAPYEGQSRWLTAYWGRSDMGQEYWGLFPLYGNTYRSYGADHKRFFLFPLYLESTYDDATTIRLLWPFITYANSPGRSTFKIWPIIGKDKMRNDYLNMFLAWPFFQKIEKYPGTPQAYSYSAFPFPLYTKQQTAYSASVDLLWPFITYYHHYATGHKRYSFRPFFSYGTGGGIEELSLMMVYSSKKDRCKGTSEGNSNGYISVGDDEIFTERKFFMVSSIQKRYRKGLLTFAKYKFWPFAEYSWDLNKGSHLKVPELTGLKSDWWDINLGRLLRFVDIRETPITKELSYFFGLSQRTELKHVPHVPAPPKPGEDSWSELIAGSFGKR